MYKQRNTPMEKVIGQSVQNTNQVFLNRYVDDYCKAPVSYTHLRAHETDSYLVCRLLLEKKMGLTTPLCHLFNCLWFWYFYISDVYTNNLFIILIHLMTNCITFPSVLDKHIRIFLPTIYSCELIKVLT